MPTFRQKTDAPAGAGGCPGPAIPMGDDEATVISGGVSTVRPATMSRGSSSIVSGPLPPKGSKPQAPPPAKPNPIQYPGLPKSMQPNADKAEVIEDVRASLLLSQYEELNRSWERAEKQLAKFRVPHDVQVDLVRYGYGDERELEGYKTNCIVWSKRDNVWRICWGATVEPRNEDPYRQIRPISDCPMDERVEAAQYLPALIHAMRQARDNYIPKVAEACEKIRSALKFIHVE